MMKRRAFITLLGVAVTAWPLAARTQQAMPLVVFLRSAPLSDAPHLVMAFRQGLTEAGFVEGKNVGVEYHSAENDHARLTALVDDLIRRPVAVIVANVIAAVAAKAATATVPIIFTTGSDPVQDGLVTSFNRPGGNVTGVSFFAAVLGAKRLELLRQLVPTATTIAVLVGPESSDTVAERRDVEAAAQVLGQNIVVLTVTSDRDLETAFATLIQRGAGALLAGTGAFMYSQRERIAVLAARYAIPAIYATRDFAAAGGLMSYAGSITEAYRQAGIYAGRILKGERPGDLPVMQSTKFELVINLKTAKALKLTVPQTLLVAADEVIE
jgi:putative ABC transport system substrate-binding protein